MGLFSMNFLEDRIVMEALGLLSKCSTGNLVELLLHLLLAHRRILRLILPHELLDLRSLVWPWGFIDGISAGVHARNLLGQCC